MKFLPFILTLSLLYSCASLPPNTELPSTKIAVAAGPEDFAFDNSFDYPRLLVSCNERRTEEHVGEIYELDLRNDKTKLLPRVGNPNSLAFNPHGVNLQVIDGKPYLYVISHDEDPKLQLIFKYLVEQDKLTFVDTICNPKHLISPNDIAVSPNEEIYFSNDAGKRGAMMEQLLKLKRSHVVYHNPKTNEWRKAADKMVYANGVAIRDDKVYVATTRSNKIFQFDKDENGVLSNRTVLSKIKGLDNLMFHNNKIITTSHPKLVAFIKHVKTTENKSPSLIHEVDLDTGESKVIFADDGKRISASSTGFIYEGNLYIAQVFDPWILKVKMD